MTHHGEHEDQAREARLRRQAERMGYSLAKARTPESVDNLGGYQIRTADNVVVHGSRFELDLDEVEVWLHAREQE